MSTQDDNDLSSFFRDILQNGLPSAIDGKLGGSSPATPTQSAFTERSVSDPVSTPDRAALAANSLGTQELLMYGGVAMATLVLGIIVYKAIS